ncbi:MAG: hypothetical protein ABSG43_27160 [Solirubrobacteraceae bacterium]
MRDERGKSSAIDQLRAPGWSCPFCDADNPQTGHDVGFAVDQNHVERRCDYCEKISVHMV